MTDAARDRQTLAASVVFRGLGPPELDAVMAASEIRQTTPGQLILTEGTVGDGVYVITPNTGLRSPDTLVTATALRAFGGAEVASDNLHYRRPLERSANALAAGQS